MAELSQSAPAPALEDYSTRVTKRKLEEAIQSLDASLKHVTTPVTASNKKRRAIPSDLGISTPLLLSLLPTSRSTARATSTPPSYTPLSLPSLLVRLATYRLTSFSLPKPPSLLQPSLALQGWQSTGPGRDRIQCVTCGKGLVLAPPSSGGWSSSAGKRLTEEYERLTGGRSGGGEAHEGTCPWRIRAAQRSLYRVTVGGRKKTLEEVAVGSVGLRGLEGMNVALGDQVVSEEERRRILKAMRELESGKEPGEEAILLSLFGWGVPPSPSPSTLSTTPPPVISCTLCHRQALTSSYLPSASSPSSKTFNPLTSHASYCPFIDPFAGSLPPSISASSSSLSSLAAPSHSRAGWKLRMEAILGLAGRRDSAGGPVEGAGEKEQQKDGRSSRELLSYVRGLLGPKRGR